MSIRTREFHIIFDTLSILWVALQAKNSPGVLVS